MTDFFEPFFTQAEHSKLREFARLIKPHMDAGMSVQRWGDLPQWLNAYAQLPDISASESHLLDCVRIGKSSDCSEALRTELKTQLKALMPWRKGPFEVFGIDLDTEWRSDWKWQRVVPHLSNLRYKTVLDVGCGNGYYGLRMLGAGAQQVVGIDPSPRFVVQFYMLKKYLGTDLPVDVLPLGIEALPENLNLFDICFSMGVFYHRRSPMDHLRELKDTLVNGGELVLETLVIDGKLGDCLVPEGRYAMMNNVWFLPSCLTLESWLKKCGFKDIRCVDESLTTTQEQRVTEWMTYHSLADFLDKSDPSKTVEGHPAPKRAVFIARK